MNSESTDAVKPQVENSAELMMRGLQAAEENKRRLQNEISNYRTLLQKAEDRATQLVVDYQQLMGEHQKVKADLNDARQQTVRMVSEAPNPIRNIPPIAIDHAGHVNFAIRWCTIVVSVTTALVILHAFGVVR